MTNFKHQITNKLEIPIVKTMVSNIWIFVIEIYLEFVVWVL
jgi:hypothetical protein